MQEMLSELADELPDVFFRGLSGGVALLPQIKRNPAGSDLYILGEYIRDILGVRIVLYYGSFLQVFGEIPPQALRQKLRKTLRHEFRHHVEALSGIDDLGIEDARALAAYLREEAAGQPSPGPAETPQKKERRFFRRKP